MLANRERRRSGLSADTPLQLPETYCRQNQPLSSLLLADSRRGGLLFGILCAPRALGLSQRFVFSRTIPGGLTRAVAILFHRTLRHSIRRDDGNRLLHLASAIKETIFPRSISTSGQAGNTAVQVWTVEEGFGIGGKFRQRRCAANFRDHKIVPFSLVQVAPAAGTRAILKRGMMRCRLTLADSGLQLRSGNRVKRCPSEGSASRAGSARLKMR